MTLLLKTAKNCVTLLIEVLRVDISSKYQEKVDSYKLNSTCLWKLGLLRKEDRKFLIDFGSLHAFVKVPHSLTYKLNTYPEVNAEAAYNDNHLATASELIASKLFKQLGFLTADYFPQRRYGLYYLASPNFLEGVCQYVTLSKLLEKRRKTKAYETTEEMLLDAMLNSSNNISYVLDNRQFFLQFMTKECYDKYIAYMLVALFTFSNDEHNGNIILCKRKTAKKFEDVFIYDKESTGFNYYLALGISFRDIKFELFTYNRPSTDILVNKLNENYDYKYKILKALIEKGEIGKKHIDLIKQYVNIDFDKLCEEVASENEIVLQKSQLDFYKLGQDCAGELISEI